MEVLEEIGSFGRNGCGGPYLTNIDCLNFRLITKGGSSDMTDFDKIIIQGVLKYCKLLMKGAG